MHMKLGVNLMVRFRFLILLPVLAALFQFSHAIVIFAEGGLSEGDNLPPGGGNRCDPQTEEWCPSLGRCVPRGTCPDGSNGDDECTIGRWDYRTERNDLFIKAGIDQELVVIDTVYLRTSVEEFIIVIYADVSTTSSRAILYAVKVDAGTGEVDTGWNGGVTRLSSHGGYVLPYSDKDLLKKTVSVIKEREKWFWLHWSVALFELKMSSIREVCLYPEDYLEFNSHVGSYLINFTDETVKNNKAKWYKALVENKLVQILKDRLMADIQKRIP